MSGKPQVGDRKRRRKWLRPLLAPVRPARHAPFQVPSDGQAAPYKMVFHLHTNYSDDGNYSPAELLEEADRRQITCLAVTDHDTMEGARRVAEIAPDHIRVIPGQEISTADGHVIGLFLDEEIPPGLSAWKTAQRIRRQGGLVIVPHPFNTMFDCSLRRVVYDLLGLIDAVEVFNAQNLSPLPNRKALAFARANGLPAIVGGDVHHRGYLDSAYQWLPRFEGPGSLLKSLQKAHFVARRHPLSYFVRSANVFAHGKLGRRLPGGYGVNCTTGRGHAAKPALSLPKSLIAD